MPGHSLPSQMNHRPLNNDLHQPACPYAKQPHPVPENQSARQSPAGRQNLVKERGLQASGNVNPKEYPVKCEIVNVLVASTPSYKVTALESFYKQFNILKS